MKSERADPSYRCVRCGEEITADSRMDLNQRYTQHVVNVHGKPSMAQPGDRNEPVSTVAEEHDG